MITRSDLAKYSELKNKLEFRDVETQTGLDTLEPNPEMDIEPEIENDIIDDNSSEDPDYIPSQDEDDEDEDDDNEEDLDENELVKTTEDEDNSVPTDLRFLFQHPIVIVHGARKSGSKRNTEEDDENDEENETDDSEEEDVPASKKAKSNSGASRITNPASKDYDDDEFRYYRKLSASDKLKIANAEKAVLSQNKVDIPNRFKLLMSDIDDKVKAVAIRKLNYMSSMSDTSDEYYKLSAWMDSLCRIPFGKYRGISLIQNTETQSRPNPVEVADFLGKTKSLLDDTVYGHRQAKDQFIRYLAQWIVNPQSKGSVIGIHGKPGVGKTTLVKDGICKALDIPFAFIPLGGASDGSFLVGHSQTYVGSIYGRIVDVLMTAGCMNPILYFDELDKVSDTRHGQEIINILIHLTDPGQNDHFQDKYFADVPIDLSRCIIVFTFNDIEEVNPILRDRITCINADDYTVEDKVAIAQRHLMPSLEKQMAFTSTDVLLDDRCIKTVIQEVSEEAGVRNLRRGLEYIYSTLNLRRLLPATSSYEDDTLETLPRTSPFELNEEIVKKILAKQKSSSANKMKVSLNHMYL
jgi:ATP-dependent Lon protease